jgi:phosphoserine phosphatase
MSGEMPLEKVYGERLKLIQPSRSDVAALSEAYVKTLAPDAAEAILALREAKVGVTLVSGGIWQAIQPVARRLGLGDQDLNAVSLFFDDGGRYAGFDARSPLTRQTGKAEVLRELLAAHRLKQPVLAVGDGATDTFMRGVADRFAAFTGFARRESVVAQADLEIGSFAELERVVLG